MARLGVRFRTHSLSDRRQQRIQSYRILICVFLGGVYSTHKAHREPIRPQGRERLRGMRSAKCGMNSQRQTATAGSRGNKPPAPPGDGRLNAPALTRNPLRRKDEPDSAFGAITPNVMRNDRGRQPESCPPRRIVRVRLARHVASRLAGGKHPRIY